MTVSPEEVNYYKIVVEAACGLSVIGLLGIFVLIKAYINGPHADVNAGINTGEY